MLLQNILRKPSCDIIIMRKNSTSKNARLLSQFEGIPCMSNEKNATESSANLSNDTIHLNTEIQTFMNDTYNEFEFYLQDDKITNSMEKCQKVSTYIDWRGMDYVNLLLSKKQNYNISCLVEDWNNKQNSFETHIINETSPTCNIGKFHYCPLLYKNNNCTSPYKNSDLAVSTTLTYDKLNESTYEINKTEIQTFMNDTYNEFEFYLQDDKITNSMEKCQKVSTYIDWRGMDYVNLLLSKKQNYNISCLVEDWNNKQNSFETHIINETSPTCNIGKFHYCPLLYKNNNCTSPYKNSDLAVSTTLTYDKLNESTYEINKTEIIEQRRSKFYDLTYDISNYYFNAYDKDRSKLNCAKWSMYIYKRGKLYVNMMTYEINSDEPYVRDSINVWNSFSQSLQQFTLEETKNRCNMTELIYKIKEKEKLTKSYDLSWVTLDNNRNGSNETLDVITSLQHNIQSTNGPFNISHDVVTTNSTNNNTFSSINNDNITTKTPIGTTIKPITAGDQITLETTTTASDVTAQTNSLISDTKPEYNLNTTKSSPSYSPTSDNAYSSSDSTMPTVSSEPSTDSTTFIKIDHQLSPNTNTTQPNENSTIFLSVNKSASNKNSYTSSPTIIASSSANDSISSNDTTSHSAKIVEPSKSYATISLTNIESPTGVSSPSSETSPSPKIINSTTTNSSFPGSSAFPTSSTHKTITLPSKNYHKSSSKSNTTNSLVSIKSSTNNTGSSFASNSLNTTISPKSLASSIFNTFPNNVTKSPTTISNISLLGTNNPQLQNSKNTTVPIIQDKIIVPLDRTYNSALKNNVSVNPSSMTVSNNSTTQTSTDNSNEITPTVNPTGNVLITVVPIGIFILGIIFLLILLCRYTPIGSWIRNRKSKKKKTRKKMKEISKEPILMSLNDIESEPTYGGKYSLLHHEKQIPLCEISFERERNLKYRQMKKSKECKEIYRESENKRVCEVVEEVSNYKNESSIEEEKLNKDDTINENEEEELNESKSGSKIRKEKLIKSGLKKNVVHVVGYTRKNTLNDGETNEINVKTEKSAYEKELKNLENKMSIKNEVCNWNTWANIHIVALLEYKKEEWELYRNEFLKICIEEFERRKKYLSKRRGHNLVNIREGNVVVMTQKNSSIFEKWKKEEWFINLKKEWKKEEEKHLEYLDEQDIENVTVGGICNLMLDKKKKAWRKWIEKQREYSNEYKKQDWLKKLLEEYEKEVIHKNIKEGKIENISVKKQEKEKDNEIDKYEMKKKLTQKMLVDIHMMVLEECEKEELENEKDELLKTNTEGLEMLENLCEDINILEKIGEERSWDSILKKKKEDIEKWKREKWFIELMLEWKDNEEKYIEELNKKTLETKNEERITNIALERQKIVWKKHWEDIYKKWIENDNKEEWFTKLVDEIEIKENEYKSEITKKNIEKKKENEEDGENINSKIEINNKRKEKIKKYEKTHLDDTDKKINSIIKEKKLKWKTIIEIHMIVLEECKKEEWLVNRGKFLETCLEEFKNEDKEKYPKIMENYLAMMSKGEEDISALMIERQKLLWKKWVERNKRMSEKWKKEEWFINLKEEWGKEQEKYDELTNESEIVEIEAGKNPMLEKQKRIWKQWIKKQRMWFIENSKEEWFNYLLDEYEKEEEFKKGITKRDMRKVKDMNENIEKMEQKENEEIEKCRKKEKLIQKVFIDIHMTVLEECKKEEFEKEKEDFFKTIMEELRIQGNSNEVVYISEIKKKSRNIILEKEKEEIEDWKKKKWFIELMLEMKNKEKRYIKEIYEEVITKKNQDRIKNPMLEKQKTIWKKHWEDIHKRWLEKNNEGCFTTLIF
ncbi:surface-associated interspersed protein (SURFIN), pseudogene [Plasmodium gallinaceum]|uniref:surface-associated interspersed protein (SURFIN), pseudogene n=1 Tax=Plasmodium gallinaceum TaxID=5849 RepID=UPI0009155D16|nr:LOW QUALITY PROTEIN: surface-associated interspersed protein (SURFIN), pseudogene [Plasmodium gallinaceum]CRG95497.1 surface-associated interspersed protein (SURFIN), pseudogene [Plasmodium gallinaceum]